MPIYVYSAIDGTGKKKTGTVDARTEPAAVGLLKAQGLFVVSLEEQKENVVTQILSFGGVPDTEIVTVTRQLATMISAGLPIARGLEVLAEQSQNRNMRKILLDTLRDVQGGANLSNSLAKYPRVFGPTYIALVKAGEASGKLEEILKRLADTLESQRDFKSKFVGAMVYPAVIFVAMIGVFALMMIFVIPKLAQMYESLNVELPVVTRGMIAISDFIVQFWYLILILLIGAGLGIKSFLSNAKGREYVAGVASRAPIFGKIIMQKDLAEFSRTLSLLISAGIPITEALNIVSNVVTNPRLKAGAIRSAEVVEKGGSLSDYLKQDKNFPPLLGQMATVGEETGQLDEVLERIGIFYTNEADHSIKGLSSALEPVILVILGAMVGLLIVSIITPIYKITSAL